MSDVTRSVDGSTLVVEISRPDRANALRCRTIREIEAELDTAEAPESGATQLPGTNVSGVVITGASKRFSAGADLAEFTGSPEDIEFDDELERLSRRITHSPLPVVAAVEGACYGGAVRPGLGLRRSRDFGRGAPRLAFNQVGNPVQPGVGGPPTFPPRLVGRAPSHGSPAGARGPRPSARLGHSDPAGRYGRDRRTPGAGHLRRPRRHGGHQGPARLPGQQRPLRPRPVADNARGSTRLTGPQGGPPDPPGVDQKGEKA